ncbi:MAG: heavy metal translocating P-type ATPase [Allobranchiibius sp.]
MTTVDQHPDVEQDRLELDVGGMSCAACANRVEQKLNKLPGVYASVNLATDRVVVTGLGDGDSAVAIAAVESAGYTAVLHNPDDDEWTRRASQMRLSGLRRRLAVSALLTVPLCDLTILLALVPGLRFNGWQALCVLLAIPIVTWAAWPFHKATWRGLQHGVLSMDTLVSLGALVSFGWALYALLVHPSTTPGYWLGFGSTPAGADAIYLDVAAGMVTFQLGGRYFETRARGQVGDVMQALASLAVKQARILKDGIERLIPTEQLQTGDRFVVLPGERVVADGVLVAGGGSIDTSAMTGESTPSEVADGEQIIGGTTNLTGRLVIEATAVGQRTRLAQMAAIAQEAQRRKSRAQKLADRVTGYFVPVVMLIALGVAIGWWFGSGADAALANGVAVLIIACPCALGLATPTALMVGIGRGGQLGILIKGHDALEASGRIDTVVFDKTGTLTTGRMRVQQVELLDEMSQLDVVRYAAALESASEHPIAAAVVRYAEPMVGRPTPPELFEAFPGAGAVATIDGLRCVIGTADLLERHAVAFTGPAQLAVARAAGEGNSAVLLAVDGRLVAVLAISDTVRTSAAPAVQALHEIGLHTVLLTGDSLQTATVVAGQLGIQDVYARVLPDDKAARIEALRAEGRCVAMVGDGINDSAALATADLGMALVRGTDIAMKSADIILVRDDLRVVVDAVQLARRTQRTIRGNLVWAFAYNVAAIPIAAAGLLNPLIAAAAMAMSSMLVISNSLRLRNFAPHR